MADDLERRVDALETGYEVLRAAVGRIGSESREMQGRAAALERAQGDLRVTMTRVDERCSDIRTGLAGVLAALNDASAKIGAVNDRINALDKDWRRLAITTLAPALGAIVLGLWVMVSK